MSIQTTASHAGHNTHYPDPLCSTCFPDVVARTVEFGLDVNGTAFDVAVDMWSDGMATTSARHASGSYDEEDYDTLLVTTTGPTVNQITEAIDEARQAAWERHQERIQG
jgi:hypothetical protein